MNNIEIISMVNKFPIGGVPQNRSEQLSKASIISYLSRYQEQFLAIENSDEREMTVRAFLGRCLSLNEGESLPTVYQAENILKLSRGFIDDFGKVQYIKETNPDYEKTYDMIAGNLGLTITNSVQSR